MKYTKPYKVKAGRKTVKEGTRSECLTWAHNANGDLGELTIERNPKFPWLDRETDK